MSALRHARVAFTGRLATLGRAEAERLVRAHGGVIHASVTRFTSLVVVGARGWPLLPDGAVSRGLLRAEEFRAARTGVRIISEREFRELAGLAVQTADEEKRLSLDDVARSLAISTDVISRWEQLGLVRARDGRYDFQDLVALRTIAELTSHGVRTEAISASLHRLEALLPDVRRPLAQLRILGEGGGRLLAELDDLLLTPEGQLLLRFDAPAVNTPDRSSIRPIVGNRESAEECFARGVEAEEAGEVEEAERAYRRAIELDPTLAEAHFNLGNVLRELGRADDARAAYRAAGASQPGMAEAWYNLADVCEELGELEAAIDALERALRVDPLYGDAHFNLAHCYERRGRAAEAARHFGRYLQLDRGGVWAEQAARRMAALQTSSEWGT